MNLPWHPYHTQLLAIVFAGGIAFAQIPWWTQSAVAENANQSNNVNQLKQKSLSSVLTKVLNIYHWLSDQIQMKASKEERTLLWRIKRQSFRGNCYQRLEKIQLVLFVGGMFGNTVPMVSWKIGRYPVNSWI